MIAEQPFDVASTFKPIDPSTPQPCGTLGLHPNLQRIGELYDDGDAALFANIGPLVEPLTVEEWSAGAKATPPSVGAHNVQRRHAQTLDPTNEIARGFLGRALKVLDGEGFNAAGYTLGGLPKALEGSEGVPVVDLNSNGGGGAARLVDYDALKADVERLTGNVSSSIFAESYASLLGPALRRNQTSPCRISSPD